MGCHRMSLWNRLMTWRRRLVVTPRLLLLLLLLGLRVVPRVVTGVMTMVPQPLSASGRLPPLLA